MRRIVVVGGSGFFGRTTISLLRESGARPVAASRRPGAELRMDAGDPASLRRFLRPGDVVVDAAGPFQRRSTELIESAIEIGFDVVDLSDSLDYALRLFSLETRIDRAGIRVLTSCSSLSTVVASQVRSSGIRHPVNIAVFLAPATRMAATPGTGASLVASVGRSIRILRGGRLVEAVGWSDSRPFILPDPVGAARGYLTESVDSVILPPIWPTLQEVSFWVDSRVPGLNLLLSGSRALPPCRWVLARLTRIGAPLVRSLGSTAGGMFFDISGEEGRVGVTLFARRRSYLIALAPLILAVRALAEDRFAERGLVRNDRHVCGTDLNDWLRDRGIEFQIEKRHA